MSTMTAPKTGNPQTDRQLADQADAKKHLNSLQAPSRHERLAKHLLAIGQTPADLDDHAALVALHASVCGTLMAGHVMGPGTEATEAELTRDQAEEAMLTADDPDEILENTVVVGDAYPTEDGHAKLVVVETQTPASKASKREGKQALARLVVEAIDAALKGLTMDNEDHAVILAAMTQDQAARTTAQWIHHLPTGGVWPAEILPKPDRSDWR